MAWGGVDPALTVSVYSTGYGFGPAMGLTREDLLDLITNFEPWDNIVFAMLPKRRAKSTTHEWPVDVLPTVARSGVPDGAAFEAQAITVPKRLKNFTQIFRWDTSVTGTEQEVDTAGIGDKLAYQILNGTHAMAKAVEQRIFDIGTATNFTNGFTLDLGNSLVGYPGFATAGGGVSVAAVGYGGTAFPGAMGVSAPGRRMAPLMSLIAQSGLPSNWTNPVVDRGNGGLRAQDVDDVCEIMFGNGLKPETLVVHQSQKRKLATDIYGLSGLQTRFIQASERKVIRGVDVYEGELTNLSVVPNRSVPAVAAGATGGAGTAWVLQKDKLGIAFLRPIKAIDIAVRGDSKDKMLIGEMTLELLHPVGAGVVARVN